MCSRFQRLVRRPRSHAAEEAREAAIFRLPVGAQARHDGARFGVRGGVCRSLMLQFAPGAQSLPLQIDDDHAAQRQQAAGDARRRQALRPARDSRSGSRPAARRTGSWWRARPAGATARRPSCHRRRGSARCRDRSRRRAPSGAATAACSMPDGRNGDSTSAPITMFQAETVSGLWRANSGFWTMLAERGAERRAEDQQRALVDAAAPRLRRARSARCRRRR